MKRIDNPRRNVNVPDTDGWHFAGLGGLRRTGPATLSVDPGPPQPDDGPVPSSVALPTPVHPILIATLDVPIELGAVQQLAALGRVNTLPAAQAEILRGRGQAEDAAQHERIHARALVGTPDLHRGDAGIALGTVLAVKNGVLPLSPGPDIGCGMRVLTTDLRAICVMTSFWVSGTSH